MTKIVATNSDLPPTWNLQKRRIFAWTLSLFWHFGSFCFCLWLFFSSVSQLLPHACFGCDHQYCTPMPNGFDATRPWRDDLPLLPVASPCLMCTQLRGPDRLTFPLQWMNAASLASTEQMQCQEQRTLNKKPLARSGIRLMCSGSRCTPPWLLQLQFQTLDPEGHFSSVCVLYYQPNERCHFLLHHVLFPSHSWVQTLFSAYTADVFSLVK